MKGEKEKGCVQSNLLTVTAQYTAQAMKDLQKHGLTIPNILKTDTKDLDKLIKCVGFHNKKAEYIKKTTQQLHEVKKQ